MNERSTLDEFERRIASGLERYVAVAVDPKPPGQIAWEAMRPRGVLRQRSATRDRRILLLGLAATLLLPLAYFAAVSRPAPTIHLGTYLGVLIRHTETPDPGIDISGVSLGGAERLLRHVSDSVLPGQNSLSTWGLASQSGWITLAGESSPWPLVLVNLRDEHSTPWIVPLASLGAIGPRWGPTGLLAAPIGLGNGRTSIAIVDPDQHSSYRLVMEATLPGGGPSIAWTADGKGLLGVVGGDPSRYVTAPIDGGPNIPGVPVLDDSDVAGAIGLGPALRVCPLPGENLEQCPEGPAGSIQLVQIDGSATTIYRDDQSPDRAINALAAAAPSTYWALFDHNAGRQLVLRRLDQQGVADIATIDRAADWQHVGLARLAPDESIVSVSVYNDHDKRTRVVLVPIDDDYGASSREGFFAGFIAVPDAERARAGEYAIGLQPTARAGGARYRLPSVEQIIAEEQQHNPGVMTLAKGSGDGVVTSDETQTSRIELEGSGQSDINLYCVGRGPMTVRLNGALIITNSCVTPTGAGPGGEWLHYQAGDELQVEGPASTSWRLFVFYYPD